VFKFGGGLQRGSAWRDGTHPSALLGDPLGDLLGEDEADDEADDVGEEATDAALNDRHRDAISKTQERQHAAPRYTTVSKQSTYQYSASHGTSQSLAAASVTRI